MALDRPLFENHTVELIIRVLPLEVGYSAEFFAFHPRNEAEMPILIHVLALEQVNKGDGILCDAWKVETHFGAHVQWYWISTEGRELLKQSSLVGSGVTMEFRRK